MKSGVKNHFHYVSHKDFHGEIHGTWTIGCPFLHEIDTENPLGKPLPSGYVKHSYWKWP